MSGLSPPVGELDNSEFPYFKLAMISSSCFASAISFSGLFPYVGFMVADLMNISRNEAGYYAGYITAAMMVGRVFTSVPWGVYADKEGRKPALLIGLMTICITSIAFGLSVNIYMALVCRFLLGAFNPIIAIGKTLVSEVCPKKHEAQGMSILTATWGLGLALGPGVGGMIARPIESYPHLFRPETIGQAMFAFLSRFPYFLPNLVTALFALVEFFIVWTYFEETLVKSKRNVLTPSKPNSSQGLIASKVPAGPGDIEMGKVTMGIGSLMKGKSSKYQKLTQNDDELAHEDEDNDEITVELSNQHDTRSDDAHDDPLVSPNVESQQTDASSDLNEEEGGIVSMMMNYPKVRIAVIAYFMLSMVSITFDEVMPLWVLSSIGKGGLEYTNVEIGEILGYTGIALITYTVIVFPQLSKACGTHWCFRWGLLIFAPLVISISLAPTLLESAHVSDTALFVCLAAIYILSKCATTTAFTASALLINNSVPVPTMRASVNGIAMSVGSMSKAVGPCFGTTLFAWSISGKDYPGRVINYHFVFIIVAVLAVISSFSFDGINKTENGIEEPEAPPLLSSPISNSSNEDDSANHVDHDQSLGAVTNPMQVQK